MLSSNINFILFGCEGELLSILQCNFILLEPLHAVKFIFRRTVTNKMTGQNVVLTKDDVGLIENLMLQKTPGGTGETYEVSYRKNVLVPV